MRVGLQHEVALDLPPYEMKLVLVEPHVLAGAGKADELLAQVIRAATGMPLVRQPTISETTPAQRARYVGSYLLQLPGTPRDFTVFERDGKLMAQLEGQGANPMLFYGNDTWGMSFDPSLRIVFEVTRDKAEKMTLKQGGGSFNGARKP